MSLLWSWLINSGNIQEKLQLFLKVLIIFWKNGGVIVFFSDNELFISEINLFLSMIKAGFTMNGSYIGEKEIIGDESGLLNKPALFNRKKEIYKYVQNIAGFTARPEVHIFNNKNPIGFIDLKK